MLKTETQFNMSSSPASPRDGCSARPRHEWDVCIISTSPLEKAAGNTLCYPMKITWLVLERERERERRGWGWRVKPNSYTWGERVGWIKLHTSTRIRARTHAHTLALTHAHTHTQARTHAQIMEIILILMISEVPCDIVVFPGGGVALLNPTMTIMFFHIMRTRTRKTSGLTLFNMSWPFSIFEGLSGGSLIWYKICV